LTLLSGCLPLGERGGPPPPSSKCNKKMGSDWISTEPVVWIPGESQSENKNGVGEVRSREKTSRNKGIWY